MRVHVGAVLVRDLIRRTKDPRRDGCWWAVHVSCLLLFGRQGSFGGLSCRSVVALVSDGSAKRELAPVRSLAKKWAPTTNVNCDSCVQPCPCSVLGPACVSTGRDVPPINDGDAQADAAGGEKHDLTAMLGSNPAAMLGWAVEVGCVRLCKGRCRKHGGVVERIRGLLDA